jgi:hypothetical protein
MRRAPRIAAFALLLSCGGAGEPELSADVSEDVTGACAPACGLLECGSDPVCGASCGDCSQGVDCIDGECKLEDEVFIEDGQAELAEACQGGAPGHGYAPGETVHQIPLHVWIELNSDLPAMTPDQVALEVAHLNQWFEAAGIQLYVYQQSTFTDIHEETKFEPHYLSLVFWHHMSKVCGKACLGPCSPPSVNVQASCLFGTKRHTTVHEVGHALGLYHTHGPSAGASGVPVEVLDSDCHHTAKDEGDYLCDTAPDPGRSACPQDEESCEATCTAPWTDYQPPTHNVMSYYQDACQSPDTAFSPEQIAVMRCVFSTYMAKDMACPDGSCGGCGDVCDGQECGFVGGCNCGSCGADFLCAEGSCEAKSCEVLCQEVDCGTHKGCDCAGCSGGAVCVSNTCLAPDCVELCAGKACGGAEGCFCGDCPSCQDCEEGACAPSAPSCGDKACGFDTCGNSCGTCSDCNACLEGACVTVGECCLNSDCDDGNVCTVDYCQGTVCKQVPAANGVGCGDDKVCGDGQCVDGCICEPGETQCEGNQAVTSCDDSCKGWTPTTCNDGNPCSVDYCAAGACTSVSMGDGVGCGDDAQCQGGQCESGCAVTPPTDGAPDCPYDAEGNDAPDVVVLPDATDSDFTTHTTCGYASELLDVDYLSVWVEDTLLGSFEPEIRLTPPSGVSLDMCVYFVPDGGSQLTSCKSGTLTTVAGFAACCSLNSGAEEEFVHFAVPGGWNSGAVVIRVVSVDSSTSCSPYTLLFDF